MQVSRHIVEVAIGHEGDIPVMAMFRQRFFGKDEFWPIGHAEVRPAIANIDARDGNIENSAFADA